MAQALFRRTLQFEGLPFIVLKGNYAEAIAVLALPSMKAASLAHRFGSLARSDGTLKPFGSLGVAFQGRLRLDRLVMTKGRVSQIHKQAMDKMRRLLAATDVLDVKL